MDCGDDRFGAHTRKLKGIDLSGWRFPRSGARAEEFGHVEPGGEVLALGAKHACPQLRIIVKEGKALRELVHHFRDEGVSFGDVVDGDLEDASDALVAYMPICHWISPSDCSRPGSPAGVGSL